MQGQDLQRLKGKGILTTCCCTALLGGLSSSYGQAIIETNPHGRDVLVLPTFHTEEEAVVEERGDNILRYGPWSIFPRVRASVIYDDNIYIQPNNKQEDVVWTLSPGIVLGAGDFRQREGSSVLIDYAPTFDIFTLKSRNNAIDHDGHLRAEWRPGKWRLTLEQLYQNYSGPVLDVGTRVNRSIYTTGVSFVYELSPKTSLELNGTQLITAYDSARSFNEWTVGAFADYGITPKIKIGAGINAGFLDVQDAVNQKYQQGLVRAVYSATEKVDFRGSAGVEIREFQSGQGDRLNGVFSIGGSYKPLQFTEVLLDAYRRDQNSIVLTDQNYTTTGFALGVRQAFLVNYAASLTGGFDHLTYHPTDPTVTATRKDDYFFARAAVDWRARDRLTAGISYLYRKNNSSTGVFSFDNHQIGLNLAYQF